MLGRIYRRFEQALRTERGVPVRVEYGPIEPARVGELRDVFVVQYADGDDTGAPHAIGGNPKRRFSRAIGCELHVYATATTSGASRRDHEDRAQSLVGQALLALDDVLRGGELDDAGEQIPGTSYQWAPGRGSFERTPGASAGAHYVLPFTVHETVRDTPFAGTALDEFTMGATSIASRTNVYGSTGEGAGETSCGG